MEKRRGKQRVDITIQTMMCIQIVSVSLWLSQEEQGEMWDLQTWEQRNMMCL